MKTKDYIKTFHLYKLGAKIPSTKLAAQLSQEFDELLEKEKGSESIQIFNSCIHKLFTKIDAINLKAQTEIPESFVKYLYATTVMNKKRELFPKIVAEDERNYQLKKGRR